MKKIIILLMAVSIMLTSCGKSAGLSNGGKKAGNNPLSAGATGTKKPSQEPNKEHSCERDKRRLSQEINRADNNPPATNTSTNRQPQKNNGTDNNPPAANTSTSNQLQKIDNDNIKQSWIDYAKDHKIAICFIISIAVGSFWIVKKDGEPLKKIMKFLRKKKYIHR